MEPAELRVVQLAQQVGAAALQASKVYNDAQASLELHLVLTAERLATTEGTRESLDALAQLSKLTSAHKEMFERFVTAAVGQLTNALGDLPEDRAAEYREGMASSINWNLSAQAGFYAGREEWIEAAAGICMLIESQRESITFAKEGVVFRNDDAREKFESLIATVDRVHHREVAETNERLARLARSMAILSVQ